MLLVNRIPYCMVCAYGLHQQEWQMKGGREGEREGGREGGGREEGGREGGRGEGRMEGGREGREVRQTDNVCILSFSAYIETAILEFFLCPWCFHRFGHSLPLHLDYTSGVETEA